MKFKSLKKLGLCDAKLHTTKMGVFFESNVMQAGEYVGCVNYRSDITFTSLKKIGNELFSRGEGSFTSADNNSSFLWETNGNAICIAYNGSYYTFHSHTTKGFFLSRKIQIICEEFIGLGHILLESSWFVGSAGFTLIHDKSSLGKIYLGRGEKFGKFVSNTFMEDHLSDIQKVNILIICLILRSRYAFINCGGLE